MKVKRLAPWYGANAALAETVGRELGKLRWCGVPLCGGCSELPLIDTVAGVAADLHRHIINLARVVRDEQLKSELASRLIGLIFHPDELLSAQNFCLQIERDLDGDLFCPASEPKRFDEGGNVEWAAAYFACCWMGRGGHSGRVNEFTQGLAIRWNSGGGDSARRWQSAIEALEAWHQSLSRWSFCVLDCFEFLGNAKDVPGHGYYIDAPWPDAGDEYKHRFSDRDHVRLARALGAFNRARVVIRYGDHPIIRELYPPDRWTWIAQTSRNQRNNEVGEVLIVNGPSYAKDH